LGRRKTLTQKKTALSLTHIARKTWDKGDHQGRKNFKRKAHSWILREEILNFPSLAFYPGGKSDSKDCEYGPDVSPTKQNSELLAEAVLEGNDGMKKMGVGA